MVAAETSMTINAVLVEDHPVVRESLKRFLSQEMDIVFCGEADNAVNALRQIEKCRPDLVILDISLSGSSGFELITQIRQNCATSKVIVFSMHDEKLYAERCLRAGAHGYAMKRENTATLIKRIRDVLAGNLGVGEDTLARFTEKFIAFKKLENPHDAYNLSEREAEILHLIGRGISTRGIAHALNIKIKTVQAHCSNIKQKLHLSTASELVREAAKWHSRQPQIE